MSSHMTQVNQYSDDDDNDDANAVNDDDDADDVGDDADADNMKGQVDVYPIATRRMDVAMQNFCSKTFWLDVQHRYTTEVRA